MKFKLSLNIPSVEESSMEQNNSRKIETPSSSNLRLPSGYRFVKVLGSGAFGQVVKAIDEKDGTIVAIKLQRFSEHSRIFKKEIANLKKIADSCDNLVCIRDSGLFYKKHYIVMDFIPGQTLTEYAEKNNNLELIFKELIKSLKKLHSKGFAHMDVKPDNIIISENSKVYLVDLGISCFDNKCIGGTKKFLPPDLSFGDISVKERQRADVWAIGLSFARSIGQSDYAKKVTEQILNDLPTSDIPKNLKISPYLKKVLRLLDVSKKRMTIFKQL